MLNGKRFFLKFLLKDLHLRTAELFGFSILGQLHMGPGIGLQVLGYFSVHPLE